MHSFSLVYFAVLCELQKILSVAVFVLSLGVVGVSDSFAAKGGNGDIAKNKSWSVNIIAYENCPKSENAQRIAVLANFVDDVKTGDTFADLDRRNKIFLVPGDDWRVLESNACDDDGALLQLPSDVSMEYDVFVRLVGKPGSGISAYACAQNPTLTDDDIVCSSAFVKTRYTGKGEPSFTKATNELLKVQGTPLFDPSLSDYFWVWNTNGRPHAQVWFVDADAGL
ncbi:MAG TPA: hypothetical protein VLB82_13265 [Thermodesulfobacteriota bacterium]|nr:hypothetical protein [Thermodesulfobacteriota bacterium]